MIANEVASAVAYFAIPMRQHGIQTRRASPYLVLSVCLSLVPNIWCAPRKSSGCLSSQDGDLCTPPYMFISVKVVQIIAKKMSFPLALLWLACPSPSRHTTTRTHRLPLMVGKLGLSRRGRQTSPLIWRNAKWVLCCQFLSPSYRTPPLIALSKSTHEAARSNQVVPWDIHVDNYLTLGPGGNMAARGPAPKERHSPPHGLRARILDRYLGT